MPKAVIKPALRRNQVSYLFLISLTINYPNNTQACRSCRKRKLVRLLRFWTHKWARNLTHSRVEVRCRKTTLWIMREVSRVFLETYIIIEQGFLDNGMC